MLAAAEGDDTVEETVAAGIVKFGSRCARLGLSYDRFRLRCDEIGLSCVTSLGKVVTGSSSVVTCSGKFCDRFG
jgi:hypothetical protein